MEKTSKTHLVFRGAVGLEIFFLAFAVLPYVLRVSSIPPRTVDAWAVLAAIIGGLLIIYGWMGWRMREGRMTPPSFRTVLGWAAIFAVTLLCVSPIGSADVYNYILRVREYVVHGLNPYIVPSSVVSHDLFYALSPAQWHENTVNYGPLWTLFMSPFQMLAGDSVFWNVFLFRLVPVASFGISVVFVRDLARIYFRGRVAVVTALYAWNPFLLFEVANNGHNDILMVTMLLAAWWALEKKKYLWVIPFIVLSALVKYISILMLPLAVLMLWRRADSNRRRSILLGGCIGAAVIVAVFAPFWQGFETFSGILTQSSYYVLEYQAPFSFIAFLVLDSIGLARDVSRSTVWISSTILFAVTYLVMLYAAWKNTFTFGELWFGTATAYLLIASSLVAPWFFVWVIPFGLLSTHSSARKISWALMIAAFVSYALPVLSLLLSFGILAVIGLVIYQFRHHVFSRTA